MVGPKQNKNNTRITAYICVCICVVLILVGYFISDRLENGRKNNKAMEMDTVIMVIGKDETIIIIKNCTEKCRLVWSAQKAGQFKDFFNYCFQLNLEVKRQTVCERKSENEYVVTYPPFKFHILEGYVNKIVINNVYYIANNDFQILMNNI